MAHLWFFPLGIFSPSCPWSKWHWPAQVLSMHPRLPLPANSWSFLLSQIDITAKKHLVKYYLTLSVCQINKCKYLIVIMIMKTLKNTKKTDGCKMCCCCITEMCGFRMMASHLECFFPPSRWCWHVQLLRSLWSPQSPVRPDSVVLCH